MPEKEKKLPIRLQLRLINKIKSSLKEEKLVKDLFKDYNVELEYLDLIPIKFGDIDVSAKTDHGVITLNNNLLFAENSMFNIKHYLIHELTHYLQQSFCDEATQSADSGDYLSNEFEQEGFQKQIEYIADNVGDEEAENYTENLLDHHDKEGDEREDLKDILMINI